MEVPPQPVGIITDRDIVRAVKHIGEAAPATACAGGAAHLILLALRPIRGVISQPSMRRRFGANPSAIIRVEVESPRHLVVAEKLGVAAPADYSAERVLSLLRVQVILQLQLESLARCAGESHALTSRH